MCHLKFQRLFFPLFRIVSIFSRQCFKRTSVGIFPGSDNRIAQDHSVWPDLFCGHAKCFGKKRFLPENSKAACQMTAGGKSLYHYFFRIYMVFVRIFSQMCHCFRQLQKCQRIFCRFHAVTKDRRLISLCDILNRHRFCLPVGCHLIAAARADQNERTFSVRNHLRRVVQKIGI